MTRKFNDWHANQVAIYLAEREDPPPVDIRMSVLKPLGAKWLVEMHNYIKENSDIIKNGFRGAGISVT